MGITQSKLYLDELGNLASDSFTSVMDEVTGILTTFAVHRHFDNHMWIFQLSVVVWILNLLVRLAVGMQVRPRQGAIRLLPALCGARSRRRHRAPLKGPRCRRPHPLPSPAPLPLPLTRRLPPATPTCVLTRMRMGARSIAHTTVLRTRQVAYFPADGIQWKRDGATDEVPWRTRGRMLLGLVLVTIEPVFGVRLLGWALQPKPPLKPEEERDLARANADADDRRIEASAKVAEAKSKSDATNSEFVEAGRAAEQAKAKAKAIHEEKDEDSEDEEVFGFGDELEVFEAEKADLNLDFKKRLAEQSRAEVNLIEKEAAAASADAVHASGKAQRELMHAALKIEKRQLQLAITELSAAERVELIMAVFEDGPEILLALLFVIFGGVDDRCVRAQPLCLQMLSPFKWRRLLSPQLWALECVCHVCLCAVAFMRGAARTWDMLHRSQRQIEAHGHTLAHPFRISGRPCSFCARMR